MPFPSYPENNSIVTEYNNLKKNKDHIIPIKNIADKVQEIKSKASEVLLVCELFKAIQGEWKSMGTPCTFIRTYGCNLKCGFANPDGTPGCDTPYTWKKSATEESDMNRYLPGMLVNELAQYPNHNHWVISGGEPMMQQRKFIPSIEAYKERFGEYPYIEIETNGTIKPIPEFDKYVGHYNVSVKLENSNATKERGFKETDEEYNFNTPERRLKPEAIQYFTESDKAYFKFVVDRNLSVLSEIEELQKTYNIPSNKITLMPEGNSQEDINKGSLPLVEVCEQKGYKFSTRLHILLFGAKRGV